MMIRSQGRWVHWVYAALLLALSLAAVDASAQIIRPYSIRYQANTNGDIAQIGNAILTCSGGGCAAAQAGGAGNNNAFTMVNINIDNGTLVGPTFNSSSANLTIPAGATVKFAGLYWGGVSASASRNQMLLKVPSATGYAAVTASQVDASNITVANNYAAFADVTALVQAGAANGTYIGANVQADSGITNRWGGWALIIVYESNTEPLRNLVVYDGYANVDTPAGQTISISGFLTPYSGPVTTKVGTFGFDGDRDFNGDALQVRSSSNPTYTGISDINNPADNFYNSTISDGGVSNTARNPAYLNTLGVDLDRFTLPAGVVGNGATTADILVNTGGEQYLPVVISWATEIYVPVITPNLVKTVADINGGSILPGDILRWTISMSNTGLDPGINLVVVDPIPAPTTYISSSMVVINGPTGPANGSMTDAIDSDRADFRAGPNRVVYRLGSGAGAGVGGIDSANGGQLAFTQSTAIQFDTTVNTVPAGTVISNSATIFYNGQTINTQAYTSATSAVSATVLSAPTITKTFTPSFIAPGGTSQMKITIASAASNPASMTGVTFTDPFTTLGLVVSNSPNVNATCTPGSTPGTVTGGTAGGNTIGMNPGATLAAGGSCDIVVNVTAAAAGNYVNTTGNVTSTNAGTGGTATATLGVGKLGITKTFVPSSIQIGQTASLSVTIFNPLGSVVTGVSFVDAFPSGLVVSGSATTVPSPACGVGSVLQDNAFGALAIGDVGIALPSGASGGTIAANGSCTFTVRVGANAGTLLGIFPNTINGGVTRSGDGTAGNPSNTATLTIVGRPNVSKTIAPAVLNSGDQATVTITISNPNTTTTLSRVGAVFLDNYPVGMTNTNPASVTFNCTGGSSGAITGGTGAAGGSTIGVSNMSLAPGGSCTVTSRVVVTADGTNPTGVVTFDNAPTAPSVSATVDVTALNEPTITKAFSSAAVSAGSAVTMTITLVNPSTAAASPATNISGVAFVDTFPLGMVNTSGTAVISGLGCSGGTATVTAGALSLSGLTINSSNVSLNNRTCTVTTTVKADAPGGYFNSTGTVTSTNTPPQTTPGTALLSAYKGLEVVKAFGSGSIAVGTGTTSLTLTVTNPSGNPGAISASSIVDAFPAGMQVATGGTLTVNAGCIASGTSTLTDNGGGAFAANDVGLRLTNYSVAIGSPCVITVSAVRVITSGNFVNTVDTISSTRAAQGVFPVAVAGTSTSATLSAGKVGIAKAFSTSPILVGGTTTLTFTLTNTSATAVSGIAFTDLLTSLPLRQMTMASGTVGGTCSGVASNAAANNTSFVVTAGNVPASGSCTITIQVTSTVVGSHPNQTTGVSHAADPTPGTPSNIATLNVTPPPTVAKSFLPSQVAQGGRSTLSVTITNVNPFPITGLAFTDVFPANVVMATPLFSSNGCGGTLQDSAGGALGVNDLGIRLTGGTVATNSSCVIAVAVSAATAGAYVNTIPAGGLTSNSGANPNPTSATLNVLLPLTVTKTFTPSSIATGGVSVLNVRLTNPNALDVTTAAFTDTYPANLNNTSSPAGSTSCPSGSVTAAANGTSLVLSNATVPANNFCDISVNVTSAVTGTRTNPTFNVTTGNAGTAASNVAVLSVGVPSISKSFTPNPIGPGGLATMSITITNPGAAITGVGFTDTFPTGMTLALPLPSASQCGGTIQDSGGGALGAGDPGIRLNNNGTIAANSSCTIVATVTTATSGVRTNTTTAVASSAGAGNTASAVLTTLVPPTITKLFTPTEVGVGQPSVLTIRLNNSNAFPVSGATFTDGYPAGLVNYSSPNGVTTCTGGLVAASAGLAQVQLTGGTIPASSSCDVTVNVSAATAGSYVNNVAIGALTTSNAGSNTVASNNATLTVLAPPTVVKDFIGPSYASFSLTGTTMPLNTPTVLRIRLTNPTSGAAVTGAAFTDTYPSGLVNSATPGALLAGAGCTGTISATGGANSLTVTNLTIPGSTTCTVTVRVQSAVAAFYTNSTGPVTTTNAGTAAAASGTIYAMAPLLVTKNFTPNYVPNGTATSGMTVSLINPNPYPITNGAITDNYDADIDNTPTSSTTCTGTLIATNNASAFTFTGGVVTASTSCVISIAIDVANTGDQINCTGDITTANAGTTPSVCATINRGATPISVPPTIAKSFTPSSIAPNGVSTLSFTITNVNTIALANMAFTDILPAGLVVATPALPSSTCSTGTWNATAGSTILSLSGASITTAGASCVLNVQVTGNAAGVYNNVTTAITSLLGTGNQAVAALTILDPPAITKSFNPSTISQGGVSSISFVITNNNGVAVTGLGFTDTLSNMTIVNPPVPSVSGAGCSGFSVTASNGAGLITVAGGSVPARVGATPGTCTVTVQVTSATAGVWPNVTSQTTSSAGTGPASNNVSLTVNPVTVAVSGYVYVDANTNGTRNPSEDWTSGALVYVNIVSGGTVVQSQAVTPGAGFFNFPAVGYGNYNIIVTNSPVSTVALAPAGFNFTAPTTGIWGLFVTGGPPPIVDFGLSGPAESILSGRVFKDTGFSGGTANDGILTAGEGGSTPGISGVTITATNCAATTFATTTTDGGGNYTLRVPSTATLVCLNETNPVGYLSTGASQATTALAANACTAPAPINTYFYDRTNDRICFAKTGGANLNVTELNFGDVPPNTFVADGTQQTTPGNVLFYPHVFTFESGGSVTFGTTVVATNPNITGWSELLYRDTDCDGRIEAADTVLTPVTAVAVVAAGPPANRLCVVMRENVPPAAPFGASRVVRVDATFTYTGASGLFASYSRTDTTIVEDKNASGLKLVKEVCNETLIAPALCGDTLVDTSSVAGNGNYVSSNTARPGDVLRYRIQYANMGSGSLTNLVINDATPPFTTLNGLPTCAVTPTAVPALTCTPTTVPPLGVRWAITGGAVPSGAQGIVVYKVNVN